MKTLAVPASCSMETLLMLGLLTRSLMSISPFVVFDVLLGDEVDDLRICHVEHGHRHGHVQVGVEPFVRIEGIEGLDAYLLTERA